MSERMNDDPREVAKRGDLNYLQDYFNEPKRKGWTVDDLKQLEKLYEIGQHFDADDPANWVVAFDRSYPLELHIGSAHTRLGKILFAAEIYLENKERRNIGRRGIKREIE